MTDPGEYLRCSRVKEVKGYVEACLLVTCARMLPGSKDTYRFHRSLTNRTEGDLIVRALYCTVSWLWGRTALGYLPGERWSEILLGPRC
jgi:hypothetical protein